MLLQNLEVVTELQVAEALLLLPGATAAAASPPSTPSSMLSTHSADAFGQGSGRLPLWRALRVRALHQAELFALQSRAAALADHSTRM